MFLIDFPQIQKLGEHIFKSHKQKLPSGKTKFSAFHKSCTLEPLSKFKGMTKWIKNYHYILVYMDEKPQIVPFFLSKGQRFSDELAKILFEIPFQTSFRKFAKAGPTRSIVYISETYHDLYTCFVSIFLKCKTLDRNHIISFNLHGIIFQIALKSDYMETSHHSSIHF